MKSERVGLKYRDRLSPIVIFSDNGKPYGLKNL